MRIEARVPLVEPPLRVDGYTRERRMVETKQDIPVYDENRNRIGRVTHIDTTSGQVHMIMDVELPGLTDPDLKASIG